MPQENTNLSLTTMCRSICGYASLIVPGMSDGNWDKKYYKMSSSGNGPERLDREFDSPFLVTLERIVIQSEVRSAPFRILAETPLRLYSCCNTWKMKKAEHSWNSRCLYQSAPSYLPCKREKMLWTPFEQYDIYIERSKVPSSEEMISLSGNLKGSDIGCQSTSRSE